VDLEATEVQSRTWVGPGDLALALCAGCAGVLSLTRGASAALVGVMVAVSLLPPLVVGGLLLGSGHPRQALGALELFLCNVICVNLAGVVTFLWRGVRPLSWWEAGRARRATRTALGIWGALLALLVWLVWSAPRS